VTPDYATIFLEAARAGFFIPLSHEMTLYAMRGFGYDMRAACLAAIIGATFGQAVNWTIGSLLNMLPARAKATMKASWYARLEIFLRRYGIYLLVLSWVPLMGLFTVVAGMLNVPLKRALPWLLLGEIVHYLWFLWQ